MRAVPVLAPGPKHSQQHGTHGPTAVGLAVPGASWSTGPWYGARSRQGDCSWRSPAPSPVPVATLLMSDYTYIGGVSTDLAASWATCFDPVWTCFGLLCGLKIYFQLKGVGAEGREGDSCTGAVPEGFLLPGPNKVSLPLALTSILIHINSWHYICTCDLTQTAHTFTKH